MKKITGILRIWEPDPLEHPRIVLFNPSSPDADRNGIVHQMKTGETVTVEVEDEDEIKGTITEEEEGKPIGGKPTS